MTPEAQRIAIAEACGWEPPPEELGNVTHGGGKFMISEAWRTSHLPNYLHDLNAMHEAEKVLTAKQLITYRSILLNEYDAISATATQRAEAFLKTLGLWK